MPSILSAVNDKGTYFFALAVNVFGGVFISIENKLQSFFASPAGKKKVAEEKAKALKEGRRFGQPGGSASKQDAIKVAEKMKAILLGILHKGESDWNLESIQASDIVIGEPKVDKDGNITIDINFAEGSLFRASLNPENFKEGIPNIIVHLTHGWSARGAVTGTWYSRRGTFEDTTSRMSFNGADFMQDAVDDFNALKLGKAELNDIYKT